MYEPMRYRRRTLKQNCDGGRTHPGRLRRRPFSIAVILLTAVVTVGRR
jgi:hypothetical protein